MGMFNNRWSSSRTNGPVAADPNPNKFKIIQEKQVGDYWVSEIQYPDCTNYEGIKIMVTLFQPSKRKSIDPHFTENNGIIARFEPTPFGYKAALEFSKIMNRIK